MCWPIEGASPETLMGDNVLAIGDAVAEAKPLANLDEPSQLPGPVGRCNHGSSRNSLDIFHDTRAGDE